MNLAVGALSLVALASGESGTLGTRGMAEAAISPAIGVRVDEGHEYVQTGSDSGTPSSRRTEFDTAFPVAGGDLLLRVAAGRRVDLGMRIEAFWGRDWFPIFVMVPEFRFGSPNFSVGFTAIPLVWFNEGRIDVGGRIPVGDRALEVSVDVAGVLTVFGYDVVRWTSAVRLTALYAVSPNLSVGGAIRRVDRVLDMYRPSSYAARSAYDHGWDVTFTVRAYTRSRGRTRPGS